ncbi:hypothetical protein N7582_002699 [Saccharomyces uvarum]|uniref:Uncharacterized protein n=1 Tax=Saccharomyces uvarum TaxID=230603 RepID=A0AA35JKA5_SACUV|nr:hypothetical protein N7582_002699 [Saccharomyces uvarum]CAI4064419.1 hypothetical protein SUVC_08G2460 [Saccharomyces uvarum]
MLGLYLSSLFFAFFMAQVFATKYSITFTSDDYEEGHTGQNESDPLVFHLEKNSLPPALMNQMEFSPYLVLADMPDKSRVLHSQEQVDTVTASKSVIDFLLEDPLAIAEHKKFSQIESILYEIMEDSLKEENGIKEIVEEEPELKMYANNEIIAPLSNATSNNENSTTTVTLVSTIPSLYGSTSFVTPTGGTSVGILPTTAPANITVIGGYENSSPFLMPSMGFLSIIICVYLLLYS